MALGQDEPVIASVSRFGIVVPNKEIFSWIIGYFIKNSRQMTMTINVCEGSRRFHKFYCTRRLQITQ